MKKEGKQEEAQIVIEYKPCVWSRCIFCPFAVKEIKKKDVRELKNEVDKKLKRIGKAKVLKVFSSGSFLDDEQMPPAMREYIVKRCVEQGIDELIVESLPQFITKKRLEGLKRTIGSKLKVTFAIGLEVADEKIMKKLGKPFGLKEYERAAKLLKEMGFGVRTYLMVNPPFVEDISDSLEKSVAYAKKYSDSIALINTFARPKTKLFELWMEKKWRPLSREEFEKLVEKYVNEGGVQAYYYDYVCPPIIPKEEREFIKGVGKAYLLHKHFEVWQDYIARIYEVPPIKKYALFLPCSYKKPYSKSRTHRAIISRLMTLKNYPEIHQIMISNAGVVPREFENTYPFNSYDWEEWKETDEIKEEYYNVTKRRIREYLAHKKKNYKKVFSYLKPDSSSYKALFDAASELGIKVIDCIDHERYERLKLQKASAPLLDRTLLDALINILRGETNESVG